MDNNAINNLNKKINTDNDDVLNMDKFYISIFVYVLESSSTICK